MAARQTREPLVREIGGNRSRKSSSKGTSKGLGCAWRILGILIFVLIVLAGAGAFYYFQSPCPPGTKQVGNRPPFDDKLWCEMTTKDHRTLLHGPRLAWYPGKQLKEKGQFLENKKIGEWQSWHPNGQLQHSQVFVDGKPHGAEVWWYANGNKWSENHWNEGQEEGPWTQWYESGQMKETRTRVESEAPAEIRETFASWYENGNKKETGEFRNASRSGIWSAWYENGNQQEEGEYVGGQRQGIWTLWKEDGSRAEGLVVDDRKHQTWTIYDASNNPIGVQEYNNGELVTPDSAAADSATP